MAESGSLQYRLGAFAIALASVAPLAVGSALAPDGRGHGTHQQLGLPACQWAANLNTPCPTCGMTTAFSTAGTGNVLDAFAVQPMGALLAILLAATFWGCLHAAVTGARAGGMFNGLLSTRGLWIAGGLTAAAWLYKIATWTG
ncbi:MAG: DUF2752 domain-containing protein [Planctomycetota bacterium]